MKHIVLVFLCVLSVPILCGSRAASPRVQEAIRSAGFAAGGRDTSATAPRSASLWRGLEQLVQEERARSSIAISLSRTASAGTMSSASEVERLWNTGMYDLALQGLKDLCGIDGMQEIEVGLSWKTSSGAPLEKLTSADIRVGERDTIRMQNLVIDRASNNLFAVQLLEGDGYTSMWTSYHSTDQGVTWNETYMMWANHVMSGVSASVARGHFYVGFTSGESQNEIRLCRFRSEDGALRLFDNGSNVLSITTMQGPGYFTEVVMGSNNRFTDDRLYCGVVTSGHALKLFWSLADGVTWNPIEMDVRHARNGLSYVFSSGGQLSLWLSYVDTLNDVCIDRFTLQGYAQSFRTPTNRSDSRYTSISAYQDTIVCVYEYAGYCRYAISLSAGTAQWQGGVVGEDTVSDAPAVTLEGRGGIGILYRYSAPVSEGRFTWHAYGEGPWRAPVKYADNEPGAAQPAIVYLGNKKFGMLYLSRREPFVRASYFTTFSLTATAVEQSGTPSPAEITLAQNYPNPFNPKTVVSYELPALGGAEGSVVSDVKLAVYDILGREVAVLVNEKKAPGRYEVTFDGSGLASGVYFYRLRVGDPSTGPGRSFVQTRKLLLLR